MRPVDASQGAGMDIISILFPRGGTRPTSHYILRVCFFDLELTAILEENFFKKKEEK